MSSFVGGVSPFIFSSAPSLPLRLMVLPRVVALQAQSQATQGRDLSTLASLRAGARAQRIYTSVVLVGTLFDTWSEHSQPLKRRSIAFNDNNGPQQSRSCRRRNKSDDESPSRRLCFSSTGRLTRGFLRRAELHKAHAG
jgi:hypothetical protein